MTNCAFVEDLQGGSKQKSAAFMVYDLAFLRCQDFKSSLNGKNAVIPEEMRISTLLSGIIGNELNFPWIYSVERIEQ